MAAALAHPKRLRALNLLFQGEKPVDQLAALLGESAANTAAHLKILRSAGLVTARRDGRRLFQATIEETALPLFMALRDAAERSSAALQLEAKAAADAVSDVAMETLEAAVGPRRAVLVDLRPDEEFAAGHLPGARSLPFAQLSDRMGELPSGRRVLAYCRGKYCPNARRGTLTMREGGLRAEQLRFGVPEWRAAGFAVEVGGPR